METDIELPSYGQDKLNVGSNKNGVVDLASDMQVEEQTINSPAIMKHGKEVLSQNVFNDQDWEGLSTNQVEATCINANIEPQNGLEFESKEAAYSFYREYARLVGFGITIKASRRSKKSGNFIDIKIVCSRFGSKRESCTAVNSRPCIKTDCKAGMHMKKKPDGKWFIHSFRKEHNHEICPDDFFRGRSKQSCKDVCLKNGMQLALDEGDVQVMTEYFMSMQDANPSFFYTVEMDHNRCLRSVFWVDSKGRLDYRNFCDVICIDTFYIKSKYRIPLVPIVGVNHHFQYILLGCSLIGEETAASFVWLMQTWLKAMGGLAPKVIITDTENSLKEALREVFPDTRHCFCLWHILSKIPEILGYLTDESNKFVENFKKCIYHSWWEEQFEERWWKLIKLFELKDNEWVQSLYEDRKKWVPTYMQDVFLAGMSTTVRSESIVSCFDKYLRMDSTFKEFIEQYKVFYTDRLDMEAKADFETSQKQPVLISLSPFEKQMSTIYTDAIFKKFQCEILGVVSCRLQKEREDRANVIFQVDDFEERQKFIVAWNEAELKVCCSCHSFECKGFLCRHAILIIQMSGITNIPSHYILRRWTKDAKTNQVTSDTINRITNRAQRFNDLCRRAIRLIELGSLSQDTYHTALQTLEEVYTYCVKVNNSVKSSTVEDNMPAFNGFGQAAVETCGNIKTKSTKKKKSHYKREHPEPERIKIGKLDSFQMREQLYSRAHNTSSCCIPQQDVQTLGQLSSVSLMHDGYYDSNQQDMLRLGQLHSIPGHGPHHRMPQCVQGLYQGQLGFRTQTVQGWFDIQNSVEDKDHPVGASQFESIASRQPHDKCLS